ncbi:MAG: TVP38/TMEM64 family protein [Candidatus Omnitrophica bacterium]|nr:TVP38/TMEM64 family protein [Candidatus Omnitrophota bacterium]
MAEKLRANNKVLKFVLFLFILAACWYLGRVFDVDVPYYQKILARYPLALSGLIFVLLYVVTTTFIWFGPKDVLRIASAILFGAYVSTVFVWIGEMINATVMFYLSRILGREYVQQRLGAQSKKLEKMKDDSSFLGVLAWRINPLAPFRLMDLGYGLTQISFKKYFCAIVIVSFFRILWLQFILAGIGTSLFEDISAMMDYFRAHPVVLRYSGLYFLAVIAVTIMAVAARFLRRRRQALIDSQ